MSYSVRPFSLNEPAPGPHDIEIPFWVRETICVLGIWGLALGLGIPLGFYAVHLKDRVGAIDAYCAQDLEILERCTTSTCLGNKLKLQKMKMEQILVCRR